MISFPQISFTTRRIIMSAEKTLEELQELAKPALRHAELVRLATVNTPNKAYDKALCRWPRRQATACRFLAIVLRDHGQGAFEALLTSIEHARPGGTEHAQKGNAMSNKMDEWYPEGVKNVVFGPRMNLNQDGTERFQIWFIGIETKVWLDEEILRLGLDEEGMKTLIRRIVGSTLKSYPLSAVNYGVWATAARVVRKYGADEKDMYKALLRRTVIHDGHMTDDCVGLAQLLVLEKVREIAVDDITPPEEGKCIQLIIDHMLESGYAREEVTEIWNQMISMRFERGFDSHAIFSWYRSIEFGGKRDFEIGEVITRKMIFRDLRHLLFEDRDKVVIPLSRIQLISRMLLRTNYHWRNSVETQEAFENIFIDAFAQGNAGRTFEILARISANLPKSFGEYASCGLDDRVKFFENLEKLLRGAVDRAEEIRQYGVACALAEHLGDIENADRLRPMARDFNQRIALDFGFCAKVGVHLND